jgi:hypothetical protein
MPRYMIGRLFPDGLNMTVMPPERTRSEVVNTNSAQSVTWVH